jgi:predicted amidohydrolase YtcJ
MTADLVLHGGVVFDGEDVLVGASTVAVRAGRIVAVGTRQQVREIVGPAGPQTQVVDLAGRVVLPGFVDAHVHPVMAGVERLTCDLTGITGADAILNAVRRYANEKPDAAWILGGGWLKEAFPGGEPEYHLLDEAVPDRPVLLRDNSHHCVWVNAEALRRSGLPPDTPRLLHESAMDLVARHIPASTEAERIEGLLDAQRVLHSFGVTGWQDAILGDYAGHLDPTDAYLALVGTGRLTARVVGALWWPRGAGADDVATVVAELVARRSDIAGAVTDLPDRRFRATSVKVMQDGVVESRTAGLSDPYLGGSVGCRCGQTGLSYIAPEVFEPAAIALARHGFQLHVHAIGDRAVRESLDAVGAALADPQALPDLRHHIAHLQVVDPRDVPRFAELGVTANLQALWACHEPAMDELNIPLLGPTRAAWQYPFGDLVRTGAALAMGSDWPVSSPNPLAAIEVAVTRRAPGSDDPPLLPDQAMGVRTALSAYTRGSARVNHHDDGGRLAPGSVADLAVLDQNVTDPSVVPPNRIAEVRVDLTVVDGTAVWARH